MKKEEGKRQQMWLALENMMLSLLDQGFERIEVGEAMAAFGIATGAKIEGASKWAKWCEERAAKLKADAHQIQ